MPTAPVCSHVTGHLIQRTFDCLIKIADSYPHVGLQAGEILVVHTMIFDSR